jgi:hypothetical protein
MNNILDLMAEAIQRDEYAFEYDLPVSGADLVEWFAGWRARAMDALIRYKIEMLP